MKEVRKIDRFASFAVRLVLIVGIGAFLFALILNFQLVASILVAFVILVMLGASSKFM